MQKGYYMTCYPLLPMEGIGKSLMVWVRLGRANGPHVKSDDISNLANTTTAKDLITELTPPHVQSTWGFRGKRVRATGLAAYCNYFSKKKKKKN